MKKRQGSITAALVAVLVLVLLAASAYLSVSALAARKTAQGESHLQNGEYSNALDMFRDAEKYGKFTMRKNQRVTEGIAESCFGLEDYVSALEYYIMVAKADHSNAKAVYRIGLIYAHDKDYGNAEEQLKALLEMRTYEANEYADMLSEVLRESAIKGVFKDIYDKLAPKIPGLGSGLDRLREKLLPELEEKLENREREDAQPDTSKEITEGQTRDGTGVDI